MKSLKHKRLLAGFMAVVFAIGAIIPANLSVHASSATELVDTTANSEEEVTEPRLYDADTMQGLNATEIAVAISFHPPYSGIINGFPFPLPLSNYNQQEDFLMIDRKDKRFVSCPVCGRILMKCQGECNIEITCGKCNRDIVALVDNERVMVLENRRGSGQVGQVKVSVQKTKGCKQMQPMKRAANF